MNDKMVVKKVLTCDVRERKILIDLQVPGFVCKRQIEEMFYFFLAYRCPQAKKKYPSIHLGDPLERYAFESRLYYCCW